MKICEPRLYGSELEWGLHAEDEEGHPLTATSSTSINSDNIGNSAHISKLWEKQEEEILRSLGVAATRFGFLSNGGRVYWDQARNLEYATPELLSAEDVALYEIASETFVYRAMQFLLECGVVDRFWLHKRTTDNRNNSNGNHENVSTTLAHNNFNPNVVNAIASFNATRGVYSGSGGLVSDDKYSGGASRYVTSPRLWVSRELKAEYRTDKYKPLVNVSTEGDYGSLRAHQVTGDANISPWAIKIRHAMNGVLFTLIERGFDFEQFALRSPVKAATDVAIDINNERVHEAKHWPKHWSATDWQRQFAERAAVRLEQTGDMTSEFQWAVNEVIRVCDQIDEDLDSAGDRVEWIRRRQYMTDSVGTDPGAMVIAKHEAYDLFWSLIGGGAGERLRNEKGWGWCGFSRQLDRFAVDKLNTTPPQNTRAKIRGKYIANNPSAVDLSWYKISHGIKEHYLEGGQTEVPELDEFFQD